MKGSDASAPPQGAQQPVQVYYAQQQGCFVQQQARPAQGHQQQGFMQQQQPPEQGPTMIRRPPVRERRQPPEPEPRPPSWPW